MKLDSKLANRLSGVLLPITTPFNSDGSVAFDGLRSNILKWNETAISGYVVLGSTGERVNLDEAEQLQVIATARDAVPASRLFIAGVGQQSTLGTLREIERLNAALAVDAVLVITPYFYRSAITQDALLEHYRAIADNSPLPLILYSMPALTGIKIEPATAAALSDHENIIGIKDSSNDVAALQETINLVQADFAVLTGNGTVLREALEAGACGGILAVGCVAPELCFEIFSAAKSGDQKRSQRLQRALTPLAAAVTTRFGIGGLKAALDLNGYHGGHVRGPLRAPENEARAEIQRCLQAAEQALLAEAASHA
ncbi:MAG TPA: dihydrodipicolinate synthase family protein [Pyrinomonadaceae bacterium]|nr:dihydrodipicolinate synthase family protein [Pyrinomonadaceae bacterium]